MGGSFQIHDQTLPHLGVVWCGQVGALAGGGVPEDALRVRWQSAGRQGLWLNFSHNQGPKWTYAHTT